MVERDKKVVYVAGLDGTYRREPFGQILQLIPYCDTVVKLHAVCQGCGCSQIQPVNALFTQALFEQPVASHTQINVGGAEKYKSVCRLCYRQ